MTTPTNPPPTAPASAEPMFNGLTEAETAATASVAGLSAAPPPQLAEGERAAPIKVFSHGPWTFEETGERFTGAELDGACFVKYKAALDSQAAERLSCGHPAELMQYSAETGAPLYCELCDDKSGRRDAERREMELQAELAALRASAASVQADQRAELDRLREELEGTRHALQCLIQSIKDERASVSAIRMRRKIRRNAALAAKGEGAPPAPGGAGINRKTS